MNYYSTGANGQTGSGSPITISYTQPADKDAILLIGVFIPGTGNSIGTPTWNGTNMTLLDSVQISTVNFFVYYIINPSTGAQSLQYTVAGGAASSNYVIASYKNLAQSGQPDAHTNANSAGTISLSLTTTASRCLIISFGNTSSSGHITGYTNLTDRQDLTVSGSLVMSIADDGPVVAGSYTTSFTTAAGGQGVSGSFVADTDRDGDMFQVF